MFMLIKQNQIASLLWCKKTSVNISNKPFLRLPVNFTPSNIACQLLNCLII